MDLTKLIGQQRVFLKGHFFEVENLFCEVVSDKLQNTKQ
jgi:hypothetical protein